MAPRELPLARPDDLIQSETFDMITVDQTGRRTLITGAGGGLGSHFSEAFAQAGAHVVLNDRNASDNSSGVNDLATQLQNRRLVAFANLYAIDLPGAAQKIMDDTIDLIRGLDTLILNAGVTGVAARVEDMQEEDLADVMAINFTANVSLVQAALPHLRRGPDTFHFVDSLPLRHAGKGTLRGVEGRDKCSRLDIGVRATPKRIGREYFNAICSFRNDRWDRSRGLREDQPLQSFPGRPLANERAMHA